MESGNLQVIKIDGGNDIRPSQSVDSVGILYPGERMDLIYRGGGAQSISITLDPEYAHLSFFIPHTNRSPEISNS
jgi:hypothetical protein